VTYRLAIAALALTAVTAQQPVPKSALFDAPQLLKDLQTLSADDMQGRQIGTPGGEKARAYVAERFQQVKLQPFGDAYLQPFTASGRGGERRGANVIGRIDGTAEPRRYIIVTAHYDHIGVRNGQVFNGADDNASGTAALFAIGAHLAANRPRNSVILAALDGEESGLLGARAFLDKPPVDVNAIAVNVNLDMIGRDPADKLYASGTRLYPFLRPLLDKASAAAPLQLIFGHDDPNQREDWTRDSDHYAFHQAKIPFIYIGVEDFDQHHRATDDYETMTHGFYVRAVETAIQVVKTFDASLDVILRERGGGK
jgi:Zn-dependent M28 family amino/carboxypeptidase